MSLALIAVTGFFVLHIETKAASVWYVSTYGDDSNACLAITEPCATIMGALAKPGYISGDEIMVAGGVYEIGYEGNYEGVAIDQSSFLSGGWDDDFVEQSLTSYIQNAYRGITVSPGITVTLENFYVSGTSSIGVYNQGYLIAAQTTVTSISDSGIYNEGFLTTTLSTLSNSGGCGVMNLGTMVMTDTLVVDNYGCGITNAGIMTVYHSTVQGSRLRQGCTGISNTGTITLTNSAVVDNGYIYSNQGAGLCNFGEATIINSTISHNQANSESGGGIYTDGSNLTLYNATVSHNQANAGGGIFVQDGDLFTQNSLIARNLGTDGSDDCNGEVTSLGFNLFGNTTGCALVDTNNDLLDIPALIFPAMGEPPPYVPLSRFSLAVDAGGPDGCKDGAGNLLIADQRGVYRVGPCDIGAYEYDPTSDPIEYFWLQVIMQDYK